MSNTERLFYIDSRIKESGAVTVKDVTRHFEISPRQVKRDFEYLRDRLGAPLQWIPSSRRYTYAKDWNGMNFSSEKALLFYVFARAAAGTLAYVPIAETRALESLWRLVPKGFQALEKAVRYELPGFEPVDGENIAVLMAAIRDNRAIDASYRDLEKKRTERVLVPRRIINYAGAWYCIAYDPGIKALRVFRLSRFIRIALSRERVDKGPGEAKVDRFLAASFGMFKGKGDKRASIRFTGHALEIVRDELWHPDQKRTEGIDRSGVPCLDLKIPVSRWEEILGRVLRFGPEAEALAPPEFRRLWLEQIDAMAEKAEEARAMAHIKALNKRRGHPAPNSEGIL